MKNEELFIESKELLLEFLPLDELYFPEEEMFKSVIRGEFYDYGHNTDSLNRKIDYVNNKAMGFIQNPSSDVAGMGIYNFFYSSSVPAATVLSLNNVASEVKRGTSSVFTLIGSLCNKILVHTIHYYKQNKMKDRLMFFYYMHSRTVDNHGGIEHVSSIVFSHFEHLEEEIKEYVERVKKHNEQAENEVHAPFIQWSEQRKRLGELIQIEEELITKRFS